MKTEHKPNTTDVIDKLVSAEIPDKNVNPRLHEFVTKHMVHGPCGVINPNSPCMKDGKCTKDFPKKFQKETVANLDGYPRYRRINNGRTEMVRGKVIDNRWIVPYNQYLTLKFNCHINVEVCASVKSVKYLFKYVYKGHDCANVEIRVHDILEHNEIKSFMDSRYISAPEAAWRLFGFDMHHQTHTIIRLAVHLPNKQPIVFIPEQIYDAIARAEHKDTSLTAWFKLNEIDESARQYLYADIPNHYRLDKNVWKLRINKQAAATAIGRMYAVNISDVERYYLRILLLHKRGATSFTDLRTVDGLTATTFKEAARLLGLLDDDVIYGNKR